MDKQEGVRINRYISDKGLCSRREADKWIEAGRVYINSKKATLGDRVLEGDIVKVDSKPIPQKRTQSIVIAYNKPVGVECTTNLNIEDNIIDAIAFEERIFPIGRLDKMSEGLILLTNVGDLVNKVLRSENNHEKEYIVYLNNEITDSAIEKMRKGMWLEIAGERVKTKACVVERIREDCIRMILTEGKNRQIRRMLEKFELRAKRLKRVRVLKVALGDLAPGKWRYLSAKEKTALFSLLST
ncbi:MAG: pseudouridine synthase [Bdellovibrionota bacterium]